MAPTAARPLDGKTAIVTGGASGIGAATVRRFLDQGASVVSVDRTATGLPDGLASEAAGRCRGVAGDVREASTFARAVEAALGLGGTLDVVVNNAAISLVKPIHEHTPEEWHRVFDTNVTSLYHSAVATVPVMIRQRRGLILNTGSISSVVGIAGQGAYGPSKGAVAQITRQMAVEYARHGIRVNAVCPGTVETPMLAQAAAQTPDPPAFLKGLADDHPIGRIGSPEEVAALFAFLAGDEASFITGAVLMIDGGFTAR